MMCAGCTNTFEPRNYNQRYCTALCGQRSWSKQNKEKLRQYARTFREKHAEAERAKKRKYYHDNLDREHARNADYAKRHPEKIRARGRKYNRSEKGKEKNKERSRRHTAQGLTRLYTRRYVSHNPEKVKQAQKKYISKNKHKRSFNGRNRKHRLRSNTPVGQGLTRLQWLEILRDWNNTCVYCGITSTKLTQDHVVPIVNGGTHTADNIVPACMKCNTRKNRKSVEEFEEMLKCLVV